MNNEQVMNIGKMYYVINDPDNFYQVLIKITELWKKNTTNIDDKTLIVKFFTFLYYFVCIRYICINQKNL